MGLDGSEVVFINNTFAENSALGAWGRSCCNFFFTSNLFIEHHEVKFCTFRWAEACCYGTGPLYQQSMPMKVWKCHSPGTITPFFLCGQGALAHGNNARYGPCVATGYKRLNLSGALSGYAGTMLRLSVYKLDEYDQTINIDSSFNRAGVYLFGFDLDS